MNKLPFRATKTHMKHTLVFPLLMTPGLLVACACHARESMEQAYRGKLIFLDDGAFFRADHGTSGSLPVKACSSTGAFSALPDAEIGQIWSVRFEGHPKTDEYVQTIRTRCIINITQFIKAEQVRPLSNDFGQ